MAASIRNIKVTRRKGACASIGIGGIAMPKVQRKYEFTGETKEFSGHTLHRIRAVRDFDTEFFHV